MRLHFHTINYRTRHPRTSGRMWLHRGIFAHLYTAVDTADERSIAGGHVELISRRPEPTFAARFHVGNAGSETPFDGHLLIAGTGVYWGLENGGKVAARLSRCARHKYEGRDVSVSVRRGQLSWRLWTHAGTWVRGEFGRWREKSVSINPLDYVLGGPKRHHREHTGDAVFVEVPIDGVDYRVRFRLDRMWRGRPRGPRTRAWEIDWNCDAGIPTEPDRGGWKDGLTMGSGFEIPSPDDWVADGVAYLTAWVYEQRARRGYRAPATAAASS